MLTKQEKSESPLAFLKLQDPKGVLFKVTTLYSTREGKLGLSEEVSLCSDMTWRGWGWEWGRSRTLRLQPVVDWECPGSVGFCHCPHGPRTPTHSCHSLYLTTAKRSTGTNQFFQRTGKLLGHNNTWILQNFRNAFLFCFLEETVTIFDFPC